MKKIFSFLIIIYCLLLAPSSTYAIIPPEMKMNATPNPVGSGARALGRGGAFIAAADDATSASWNPGALLKCKRSEISIVGSHFSGRNSYNSLIIAEEGEIKDLSHDQRHLNYLSIVYPFRLFQRNMVFSLNYQHLYEFSLDTSYTWKYIEEDPVFGAIEIPMNSRKKQEGALNTLSPALAVQVIPFFYFGLTANFWLNDELKNFWENINIAQGEEIVKETRIKSYAELYERYDFSGFNANFGFLWRANQWLTLGGVIKTPFKADIKHEYRFIFTEEYPENPELYMYYPLSDAENLTLKMPISYGLGVSMFFSDNYLMALDIYHTRWQDYILCSPSGKKINPINNKSKDEANIAPTTQIRLGAEYLIATSPIIAIRGGIFYDPEPSEGDVDDFYGVGLGTGIKFKAIAFDIAYQYRFGNKKRAEAMLGEDISSDVKQHYLYSSMIIYFEP